MSKKTRVLTVPRGTIKNRITMKAITFTVEFREKVNNKKGYFMIIETTINKAFKEAKKICKIKNAKMIGIREA